jgi:hypothetical protein
VFANWSDGGLQTHDITASSAGGTYTANFTEEYLLSVSVSPIAGGAVTETPVSSDGSGYYSSGALVSLTASPSVGYVFSGWGSGGHLIASASPQPVSMTAPWALTASFALRNICDIIGYATTNVADVQMIINEALGVTPAVNDLSADGVVNIADVQIVINAAAGLGCTPQ